MKKEILNKEIGQSEYDTVFQGGGEMAQLMSTIDWSQTPVGPVESWPQSLKTTLSILLNSKFGMFLWWGPELVQFYNDTYRLSLGFEGEKHPQAMGQRGKDCWGEIWHIIQPQIQQVMSEGIATWNENQLIPIYRNGILEEIYWTYSYSPVFDDSGKIAGVLVVETETTKQVIGERRSKLLRELGELLNGLKSEESLYKQVQQYLKVNSEDIPFSLLYTQDKITGDLLLSFETGLKNYNGQVKPAVMKISESKKDLWPVWESIESSKPTELTFFDDRKEKLPGGPWPESATKAYIIPLLFHNTEKPIGVLITGISPRQVFDLDYKNFLHSLTSQISTGISNIRTHEKEIMRQQELENARIEAENSRKRLYDLFMNAPAVIAVFSGPDLKFEIANPLYRQLVGVERPLDGKPLFEAIPDIEPELMNIIRDVVGKGERFIANELPITIDWDLNGKVYTKYLQLLYEPLFENGKPDGMMAFAVDISDHVHARERIQEQNHLLKMISEGTPLKEALNFLVYSIEKQSQNNIKGSILLLDNDGRHLRHGAAPSLSDDYNNAIDGITVGEGPKNEGPSDYIQKTIMIDDIATNPLWKNYKEVAERENLRACWSTPIFSSVKKVLGVFAIYYHEPGLLSDTDKQIVDFATHTASLLIEKKIAEQALKRSNEELEQQKRMYDSITGSTPDLVYVIDTSYKFTFVNEALLTMWGKTLEESIGKGFIELGYEPWHAKMHEGEVDQVIASKRPIRGEVAFPHATLGERIYDYIFAPILGANGDVVAIAGTTRDISELKYLENQKDQFIAIASHELKTPITSLKAYTQLLQLRFEKQSDILSSDFMKKMDLQINKLTHLINDLLDITKMQDGKLQYNSQNFELNSLITEITEEVQRTATRHSIKLCLDKDVSVFADRDRIGQVLINYLTNAIKYSPQSDVVNIRSVVSGDIVTVSVEDSGLGIPEGKKEKVFERFFRVEGNKQETFAGLGLGLFISKEIINRHKGEVWAESIRNKGSKFYFTLPLVKEKNN